MPNMMSLTVLNVWLRLKSQSHSHRQTQRQTGQKRDAPEFRGHKHSCPQWDSNPGPSAYEANKLSVELLELINIDHLKVTPFT